MKAIKAKLSKFQTVDEYIHGWGLYYYGAGILLPTRKAEPVGTDVSLHIQIATGETVLRGEGVVEEVRTGSDGSPVGMVIRFKRLDARSKELVQQVLEHKKESRTSANLAVVVDEKPEEEEEIGQEEIGAIAEALDETFDSIFGGGGSGAFGAADGTDSTGSAGIYADGDASAAAPTNEAPAEPLPAAGPAPSSGPGRRPPTVTAVNEVLSRLGIGGTPSATAQPKPAPVATDETVDDAAHDPAAEDAPPAGLGAEPSATLGDASTPEDRDASGFGDLVQGDDAADTGDTIDDEEGRFDDPEGADDADDDDSLPALDTDAFGEDTVEEPPSPTERVRDFISDVAAETVGDSEERESGAVLTHDEPSRSDAFRAAAADARAKAEEGEAALDGLVDQIEHSSPSVPVPVQKPKGLVARFIAWLKSLFGG